AGEELPLLALASDSPLAGLVARLLSERLQTLEFPGSRLVHGPERNPAPLLGSADAASTPARAPGARLQVPVVGDLLDALRREHDRGRRRVAGLRHPQTTARPRP